MRREVPTARPEWGVSSASREGVPVEVMGMPEVGEGRIPDGDGGGEEDVEALERGVERRRKDMVWMVWWKVGGVVWYGGEEKGRVVELVSGVFFRPGSCIFQHFGTDVKLDPHRFHI